MKKQSVRDRSDNRHRCGRRGGRESARWQRSDAVMLIAQAKSRMGQVVPANRTAVPAP